MEEKARLLRAKNDLQNMIKSVEININVKKFEEFNEQEQCNDQIVDDFEEPAAGPIPKECSPDTQSRKKQNKKNAKKDKK